ncbi:hypothetical protein [Neoaquamicrobium sediminum]|uniref:Uncharacterized protein n=1 Tax=Neoaquamicrobium sediminum TaxID=1849104 RepID=A0ABV3WZX7_9HYPH
MAARQEAEVRGAIDAGLQGDKKPGFDPAAAPMETDAEAGTTRPESVGALDDGRSGRTGRSHMQDSDGDAMRSMPGAKRSPVHGFLWPFLSVMLLLVLAALLFALWV